MHTTLNMQYIDSYIERYLSIKEIILNCFIAYDYSKYEMPISTYTHMFFATLDDKRAMQLSNIISLNIINIENILFTLLRVKNDIMNCLHFFFKI